MTAFLNEWLNEPMFIKVLAGVISILEFTLRYNVDFKMRRSPKDKLFMRFLEKIQVSNNQIKIASATVQLVEPNTFNITLNDKRKTG